MSFSITTKTGDKGTTRLFSGEEVYKDSLRTSAYGDLDECVSILGLARATATDTETREQLLSLQRALFVVGTELATKEESLAKLEARVDQRMLDDFDRVRQALEDRIEMPSGFVVPGGTVSAAHLDHARSVARRCERSVVTLFREGETTNEYLLIWLNRVSDFLWLLARFEEGGERVMVREKKR